MKFKLNDEVKIKTLDEMINSKDLVVSENDLYVNEASRYFIFKDFPFFGLEGKIVNIDHNDDSCPYYISGPNGQLWAGEFMLTTIDGKIPVNDKKPANNEPKVYINKFNNKPFGRLFIKLINIDNRIAEFSSTAFSRLKKHELQYIARILIGKGCPNIDLNSPIAELSSYCYNQTRLLNV